MTHSHADRGEIGSLQKILSAKERRKLRKNIQNKALGFELLL